MYTFSVSASRYLAKPFDLIIRLIRSQSSKINDKRVFNSVVHDANFPTFLTFSNFGSKEDYFI